jgi:hypothetical protein
MARWYALGLDGTPLGAAFDAPNKTAAQQTADRIFVLQGGGWKVMSVLEYEDLKREDEARARQAAKKLRWAIA